MEMIKRNDMSVRNLVLHVEQLSKAFDIGMVFDDELNRETAAAIRFEGRTISELDRWMGICEKMVHTRPIVDETTYVVALHEIGHHVAPNGYCLRVKPRIGCHPREVFEWAAAKLVAEEAAWEWARYYVEQVFYWTAAMEQTKQYAFETYLRFRRTGR